MARRERPTRPLIAEIDVRVHHMKESNGRITWIADLCRKEDDITDHYCIANSLSEGRVRYAADEMKWFLGQGPKPDMIDPKYDHSIPADQSTPHEGNVSYAIQQALLAQASAGVLTVHKDETPRNVGHDVWIVNGKVDLIKIATAVCRREGG